MDRQTEFGQSFRLTMKKQTEELCVGIISTGQTPLSHDDQFSRWDDIESLLSRSDCGDKVVGKPFRVGDVGPFERKNRDLSAYFRRD